MFKNKYIILIIIKMIIFTRKFRQVLQFSYSSLHHYFEQSMKGGLSDVQVGVLVKPSRPFRQVGNVWNIHIWRAFGDESKTDGRTRFTLRNYMGAFEIINAILKSGPGSKYNFNHLYTYVSWFRLIYDRD